MSKNRDDRGIRDEMNVGPDPRQTRHLVPLSELGKFKVADGDPDIRGWDVYTSTGRETGKVDELLVDATTNEVVMLDIDLKRDNRHTLAPLRAAWIDHTAKRVIIDAKEVSTAEDMPSLSRQGALTDDDVQRFDERYARAYGDDPGEGEYRVRRAGEELRFGRRGAGQGAETGDAAPPTDVPRRSRAVERHQSADEEGYKVADTGERAVRYPRRADEANDVVLERRPMVEEVVVRRRPAEDDPESDSLDRPR